MTLLIIFSVLILFQVYQGWQAHKTAKTLEILRVEENARYYHPGPEIVFGFTPAATALDGDMIEKSPAPE